MDIARPRQRDDSDQSDHVANPPVAPPVRSLEPVLVSQRVVRRTRPKRPRKPTLASLRAQREAFEFVVEHLPYVLRELDDASTRSDEDDVPKTGNDDAQRMRSFLKRTVLLTKEAQEEIAKRTEYLRLLKRHYESAANLHKPMRGLRLDYWFWMCDRWRAVALEHYKPLSKSKCYAIIQETLQAIKIYKLPEGTKQTDAFGWRDSVLYQYHYFLS